jgi:hypothetical protein
MTTTRKNTKATDKKAATAAAAVKAADKAAAVTTATDPTWQTKWDALVGAFAAKVKKPVRDINNMLEPLVGKPGPEALEYLADHSALSDDDLLRAFEGSGIPSAMLKKNLTLLRPAAVEDKPEAIFDVLPPVPSDESFIKVLQTGGVLKVGTTEVLAAAKAAIADSLGLFDLPKTIKRLMEEFAETVAEPVGERWWEVDKLVTEREYGDVLRALGANRSVISDAKMAQFLKKLEGTFWPALKSFNLSLSSWQDTWYKSGATSAMLPMVLAAMASHKPLPPNMMAPPDASSVRAAASGVNDKINSVFGGLGIPVARALAYEATKIRSLMEIPELPAYLGVTTKELMLKKLGVDISEDVVRLEQNICKYALGVMNLSKVPIGNEKLMYLSALCQLGGQIPWDKLESLDTLLQRADRPAAGNFRKY